MANPKGWDHVLRAYENMLLNPLASSEFTVEEKDHGLYVLYRLARLEGADTRSKIERLIGIRQTALLHAEIYEVRNLARMQAEFERQAGDAQQEIDLLVFGYIPSEG